MCSFASLEEINRNGRSQPWMIEWTWRWITNAFDVSSERVIRKQKIPGFASTLPWFHQVGKPSPVLQQPVM